MLQYSYNIGVKFCAPSAKPHQWHSGRLRAVRTLRADWSQNSQRHWPASAYNVYVLKAPTEELNGL